MIQIENTLLSDDVIETKFLCNLDKCRGACCVEGDSGAPLEKEEREFLDEFYSEIKPYMRPEGIKAVEENGKYYIDEEHEYVTTLIEGQECTFTIFDNDGIAQCSIEKAWIDKKIPFQKPISCYLYPIRVKEYDKLTAVNYDEWDICESACKYGKEKNIQVFKFLKKPLIQKFGKEWYKQLEYFAENHKK